MLHHILCDCVCGFAVWLKMVSVRSEADESNTTTIYLISFSIYLSFRDEHRTVTEAAASVKLASTNNTKLFLHNTKKSDALN